MRKISEQKFTRLFLANGVYELFTKLSEQLYEKKIGKYLLIGKQFTNISEIHQIKWTSTAVNNESIASKLIMNAY